ncbi:MAG: NupC/NupG family nucleoside CNT transporter [bacterium]|nr:NupC/NupG family nucleoside CNT transporter [bacterium]
MGFDSIRSMFAVPIIVLLIWALLSEDRKRFPMRTALWGIGLQVAFAGFVLIFPPGVKAIAWFGDLVTKFLSLSKYGSEFLFGNIVKPEFFNTFGFQFALLVLPTVIFFSSFMAVLYHAQIMQPVVEVVARVMAKTMKTSGAESLSCASNIFLGQTEAPLIIRPYLLLATRSELAAIMTGGFATIAGGVMAGYISMGIPAKHLIAASVMSAPAALVFAKIAFPEKETPVTYGKVKVPREKIYTNVLDAASSGATDGMKLALNIAAMLIAFLALLEGINWALGWLSGQVWYYTDFTRFPSSLKDLFGLVFAPFAWLIGVPWHDAGQVGYLIGTQISANEFIAYAKLAEMKAAGILSERTIAITTYAMCGFANFSSVAIQIGGISALVPERRSDLAAIGLKAMVCGALASWMTACVASMFL